MVVAVAKIFDYLWLFCNILNSFLFKLHSSKSIADQIKYLPKCYSNTSNIVSLSTSIGMCLLKAYMKSYIPLETAAIFFLANLDLKQGISSEYVMVDVICMGLLDLWGITKWKIHAHSGIWTRTFCIRSERAKRWAIRADKYRPPKGDRILPEYAIKSYLNYLVDVVKYFVV